MRSVRVRGQTHECSEAWPGHSHTRKAAGDGVMKASAEEAAKASAMIVIVHDDRIFGESLLMSGFVHAFWSPSILKSQTA